MGGGADVRVGVVGGTAAGEPDAGGGAECIAHGCGHGVIGALAHRLRAHRADRVVCVGEMDLGARHVGKLRQMIIAEARIDDAAGLVDHHLLIQRGTERLRNAALDLAAALHGIGDAAGVRRLHALEKRVELLQEP